MNKISLILMLTIGCFYTASAQNVITCTGSKTGAKVTYLSNINGEVKVRLDWNEGSTFTPQNLEITNGTCVSCPNGVKNNPVQTWTIKQTNLSKPIAFAWGTLSTKNYCGSGSMVIEPSRNTLKAGESLVKEQRLTSANGAYYLRIQQDDGNLCIYKTADNGFVWGSMVNGFSGATMIMQTDGNLVVYDASNVDKWSSKTHPFFDSKFNDTANIPVKVVLEDTGTLVLYNATGSAMWSSK